MNKNDVQLEKNFIEGLSDQSRHFRFLGGVHHLSDRQALRLCDVDGINSMAFAATIKDDKKQEILIGVSRYGVDNDGEYECAVTVTDDWQNRGLGRLLMDTLIDHARSTGKPSVYSLDLSGNQKMQALANDLGMTAKHDPCDSSLIRYQLNLYKETDRFTAPD